MYKLIKCGTTVIKTLSAELILMEYIVEVGLLNIIFKQKNQWHIKYGRLLEHCDPGYILIHIPIHI